jgi:hypothetical protein
MGVFQIKNTTNEKILIGSSMNLPGKKNSQEFQLKAGGHYNKELQSDWNALGPAAFTFEILETLKPETIPQEDWRKAVTALEDKWLDTLQPYGERGYNKKKENKA